MATTVIGGLKLLSRYQTLFCCLVIIWAIGIVVGSIFLAAWGTSRKSNYISIQDLHEAIKERSRMKPNNPKVLKALKYCSPLLNGNGDQIGEGIVKDNHHLEAVAIVMRHGDRGPMQQFRNLSSIKCGINTSQDSLFNEYTSYMEKYSSRRSSRDPFRHFPLMPKNNSCAPGHLTEWGFSQQLQTGRLLGDIYVKQLKLLRNDWRPEEVIVVSTMMERTYQSAISFLFAFLPKFDLAKLSFKIGLGATFCYSQQLCRCPLVEKLKPSVDSEKVVLLNLHQAVQELVDRADQILRFQRSYSGNPARPDDVFDKLLVYTCHHTDLPCHNGNSCVTVDQLAHLISFLEWRGKRLSETPKVKLLSRLSMQGFLIDLLQRITDISMGKKRTRLIMYSAHDNTLMPLLLSMGVFEGSRPPYSARLVFELHSHMDQRNVKFYYLKIIYNGKDVTKRVHFCCKKTHKVKVDCEFCLLKYFSKFVEEDYLIELNTTSYRQACSVSGASADL